MDISALEKLAFEAATLEAKSAKSSWKRLLQLQDFGNLGPTVYRILPAIYKNLQKSTDIPLYEQLKGAYRFNWSKNSKLFFEVLPILKQLNDAQIDYRVLKGGAINISFNSLGLRTMGDFDLLISKFNLIETIQIIERNGFRQKYDTHCLNTKKILFESELCFVSENNIEIDLHVDTLSYPQVIFKKMMKEKPNIVTFLNTSIPIPSSELAFLHAVLHGSKKVAVTDQIQGLIDCVHLIKKTDPKTINFLSKKIGAFDVSKEFLDFLMHTLGLNLDYQKRLEISWLSSLKSKLLEFKNVFEQNNYLLTAIRTRKIEPSNLKRILFFFNGKKLPYLFWLLFGKFRVIEFYSFKLFRGFLSNPKDYLTPNKIVGVFSNFKNSEIIVSNSCKLSFDWRLKVRLQPNTNINLLQFYSANFMVWNWLVFLNGKLIGSTPKNSESVYSVYIPSNLEVIEISFRSPLHSCSICAHSLGDLKLIGLSQ